MKTDADRVRFAVRFASENVMALGAPALNKLQRELAAFLGTTRKGARLPGGFGVQVVNARPPYPWDYSKVEMFSLQQDASALLENAIDGHGLHPTTISDDQELIADVVTGAKGKRTLRIGGSVRAGFLLTLAFLLAGTGAPTVLKCPECGRPFVRVRRQKYCRDACTDRATWRNYPTEKKRRARQRQYDKNGWTLGARSERKTR